jgi:hypothetical protein
MDKTSNGGRHGFWYEYCNNCQIDTEHMSVLDGQCCLCKQREELSFPELPRPICIKFWAECYDGKLLAKTFDSPKESENTKQFIARVRRTLGLDKYTSLKFHYWIDEEYGIATKQLVFSSKSF